MLLSFIVENFKCFSDRIDFSMVSSSKITKMKGHRMVLGKGKNSIKVMQHAAVYGANASGKSSLIQAVEYFRSVVLGGISADNNELYCRNGIGNESKDSLFEIRIELDGKYYAYGFKVRIAETRVQEEWLIELHTGEKPATVVFSREAGKEPEAGPGLKLSAEESRRFQTYCMDFSGEEKRLFLSEMNRSKKYSENSGLYVLKRVFTWIERNLVLIFPLSRLSNFYECTEENVLAKTQEYIKTFDAGVSEVLTEEISLDDLASSIGKTLFDEVKKKIEEKRNETPVSPCYLSGRTENAFFGIEIDAKGDVKVNALKFRHKHSGSKFGLREESDGTKRMFDLIGILTEEREDIVFFVDELENSLHPCLTKRFLDLFDERYSGKKMQLVFTSHENTIMNLETFRRDELWFTARNQDDNCILYSFDSFSERFDKRISKAYLEGRYGAIPIFSVPNPIACMNDKEN